MLRENLAHIAEWNEKQNKMKPEGLLSSASGLP